MRHGIKKKKFNRSKGERDSLYRNLVQSSFLSERITTTLAKAKIVRPIAEKLITRAKKQDLSSRRRISAFLYTEEAAEKLYKDISLRFKDHAGGYLRILKLGPRKSDRTPMAILELIIRKEGKAKPEKKTKEAKKEVKTKEAKKETKETKESKEQK